MGKLKTKVAEFDKETGKATYIYSYKQNIFIGEAQCHEEDMDMCSELVGMKLAETRAFLQYLKVKKTELEIRLSTLEGLIRNMTTSKDFDITSKYGKKLQYAICETRMELHDCKEGIKNIPGYIKQDIEKRDKLYQALRKRRAGEEYKVGLFTMVEKDAE